MTRQRRLTPLLNYRPYLVRGIDRAKVFVLTLLFLLLLLGAITWVEGAPWTGRILDFRF